MAWMWGDIGEPLALTAWPLAERHGGLDSGEDAKGVMDSGCKFWR